MSNPYNVVLNGPRVHELRRNQAFSQAALAKRAGITVQTLRSAEKSHAVFMSTWRAISEALGVEPSELLPEGVEV